MNNNSLTDRLLRLMSDGRWHSSEELINKISHRFSVTIFTLKKRGYAFDKRCVGKQKYEYRLVLEAKESM